eukprot:3040302-Prymnesium_polylepis.1
MHRRHPDRRPVVLARRRAARNARLVRSKQGQTHRRKRHHMQPLRWATWLLLRLELLGLRRCVLAMSIRDRVPMRRSAAVPRVAR